MFSAMGWVILRVSREPYKGKNLSELDSIDDLIDKEDNELWNRFENYLEINREAHHWLKISFTRQLNNMSGVINLAASRNHSSPELEELLRWISEHGVGSYGIIYIHDDESEFSNEFRIYKVNKGQVTAHTDPFLSPIYPVVEGELSP